jgi:hypothetical protein
MTLIHADSKTWLLDKKYFLAGSYFEKEIEDMASASPLFAPRGTDESKQDYTTRAEEANKYLNLLYDQYYVKYLEMLSKIPIE